MLSYIDFYITHFCFVDVVDGVDVVQVVDQQVIRNGEAKMLLISAQNTLQCGEEGRIKFDHGSMEVGQHGLQGTLLGHGHGPRGHVVVQPVAHTVRGVVDIVHEVGVHLSHLPNVLSHLVPVADPVAFLL